jgi:hypothetical protein
MRDKLEKFKCLHNCKEILNLNIFNGDINVFE